MDDTRTSPEAAPRGSTRGGRRLLKLLLWTLIGLGIAAGITGYVVYRSAGAKPAWYVQIDPAAASQPARECENKLIEIQTWAGSRYAWDYSTHSGRQPLVREPEPRLRVSFTEAEINGMLQKWFVIYGEEKVGGKSGPRVMDLISNPMVHITPEGITLAATVAQSGSRVLSAELRPEVLSAAQEKVDLVAIRAGTLPLPEFVWAKLRDGAMEDLQRRLPQWVSEASMDRGGGVNGEFVAAVSAAQALDTLQRRPMDNAMFLPVISEGKALPVRVESVELGEGSVTLTVGTMPLEQRRELLSRLPK